MNETLRRPALGLGLALALLLPGAGLDVAVAACEIALAGDVQLEDTYSVRFERESRGLPKMFNCPQERQYVLTRILTNSFGVNSVSGGPSFPCVRVV